MTPEEFAAILNLAAALTPAALEFANNMVKALSASDMTRDDRMKYIEEMQKTILPMKPIPD